MREKGPRSGRSKKTKTDMIAGVFSDHPLDPMSPKHISIELGLDIKLVTTIVNRLRQEGLIDRVGWGKYKLSIDNSIEDEILEKITDDMFEMTRIILGPIPYKNTETPNGSAFKGLVNVYRSLCTIGGELMAQNVLRLAANKNLPEDSIEPLIVSISEVIT
ncbi:MAG: hypothetical protein U9R75_03905 [Candidatus Thermoplasmatota archaeon]|nr:hypothetical protein [Candidatus Thermoplasmatota archaeon]